MSQAGCALDPDVRAFYRRVMHQLEAEAIAKLRKPNLRLRLAEDLE